ncbi:hypothetical protein [Nocardia amamiensis]|uniref:hypothetical protein n=1 Tax=Nocardia TaxID=1817 RepID=UPI0033C8C107
MSGTRPPSRIRRITIESGALKLAFRASDDHARSVSEALARTYPHLDLVVTVDDEVGEHLPQLPCAALWE